jgi:hypothetical protein
MNENSASNSILVQDAARILSQAVNKLEHHDYAVADVMIGVAVQMLSDVHSDIERQLHFERMIKRTIEANPTNCSN